MQTFDFNLDRANLEIFPSDIWKDPNIVFHGTSEYHSQEIESNGFIPAKAPFNLNDARELVRVLQLPEIINCDQPETRRMSVSQTLNNYIIGIENNILRLSFAYLSYRCVFFSTGQFKGGQTFGNIRDAKSKIQQAIQVNQAVKGIVTEPINRLFDLETDVANTNAVVYAVRLDPPYNGITEEYGNIHSTVSIPSKNIIGKVILPNDINVNEFTIQDVKQKNQQKLYNRGNLGIILHRRNLNDNDEI